MNTAQMTVETTAEDTKFKALFNSFLQHDIDLVDRRRDLLLYIDDEMYGWITRLEHYTHQCPLHYFLGKAAITQLNLTWFSLTSLVKRNGTRNEWTKPLLSYSERLEFMRLLKLFRAAFEHFEDLDLPA